MAAWMHVAGDDAVSDRLAGGLLGGALRRATSRQNARYIFGSQHPLDGCGRRERAAGLEFLGPDKPLLDQQLLEAFGPDFIVAGGKIVSWMQRFAREETRLDQPVDTGRSDQI